MANSGTSLAAALSADEWTAAITQMIHSMTLRFSFLARGDLGIGWGIVDTFRTSMVADSGSSEKIVG